MSLINLTSIHYIGIIYLSFAHQTDGVYDRNEQNAIWKCLWKWMPENSEYHEFAVIMDEVTQWYKSMMIDENFKTNILEIAERLNEYDWFVEERKIESLKDLRTIALADRIFHDNERKWMREIAKTWKMDNKIIRKIIK